MNYILDQINMEGWISLHRKFLEWEWYDDLNTKSLFIHCLLKANHTGKKWRGIDIKKGSFITSRNHLSIETGLSEQQIRTALKKLESTNEITIESTKLNTLISVCNWAKYQDSNQPNNQVATKEQPSSNQVATTTNNDNKDNNEDKLKHKEPKYEYLAEREILREVYSLFDKKYFNTEPKKQKWLDEIRKLIELDKEDKQTIIEVIKFARTDEFWSSNFLTITSLRKKNKSGISKFDQIKAKVKPTKQQQVFKNGIKQATEQEVINMLGSKEMYLERINRGHVFVKYDDKIFLVRGESEKYIMNKDKKIII